MCKHLLYQFSLVCKLWKSILIFKDVYQHFEFLHAFHKHGCLKVNILLHEKSFMHSINLPYFNYLMKYLETPMTFEVSWKAYKRKYLI